ncbi:MAG: MT-A70 family methyltransferase, partial [Desulfobacterales bacterium]|nr:MT-A70 family methyltransferase [Desulfobacterales bacterium]
ELVLLGKKGRPQRIAKNVKQIVMAPRGRHSAKPAEVRDRIVRLMGNVSRIELFAREKVDGWHVLGNEIDGQDIRDALQDLIEANSPITSN